MATSIDESTRDALTIPAHAKINLGLEILSRREDGFHNLNTVFARIDLADTLTINLVDAPEVSLTTSGDEDLRSLPIEKNLAYRAATEYLGEYRPDVGCEIHLHKVIPTGAGLGGGSSDAAAVLRGLQKLTSGGLTEAVLHRIATRLGSDVPFFLGSGPMKGSGRGEVLEPIPLNLPWQVLVVMPQIHVSTADAYGRLSLEDFVGEPTDLTAILRTGLDDPQELRRLKNSFERPVFEAHPELREVRDQLYAAGADLALLSGSGGALFALGEVRDVEGIDWPIHRGTLISL